MRIRIIEQHKQSFVHDIETFSLFFDFMIVSNFDEMFDFNTNEKKKMTKKRFDSTMNRHYRIFDKIKF